MVGREVATASNCRNKRRMMISCLASFIALLLHTTHTTHRRTGHKERCRHSPTTLILRCSVSRLAEAVKVVYPVHHMADQPC